MVTGQRLMKKMKQSAYCHKINILAEKSTSGILCIFKSFHSTSAESLPCLHRLQKGLWQGMARSLMGNCEEIQHQCQHHMSHWKYVGQSVVLLNGNTGDWFRTTVGVWQECQFSPTLVNIFLERIAWGTGWPWRYCQHRRTTYYQLPLCRWHWCKCRRGRRSWRSGRPSRYNHHKVQTRDWSWQDESDGKQPKWLPKRDQDKMSEARSSGVLQVPWSNHLQWRVKSWDSFQDSPHNSSSL